MAFKDCIAGKRVEIAVLEFFAFFQGYAMQCVFRDSYDAARPDPINFFTDPHGAGAREDQVDLVPIAMNVVCLCRGPVHFYPAAAEQSQRAGTDDELVCDVGAAVLLIMLKLVKVLYVFHDLIPLQRGLASTTQEIYHPLRWRRGDVNFLTINRTKLCVEMD